MGAAFFIVLNQEAPGFDTMVNGKCLSQDAKRLEKIAKSLGVRPLEEYVSYSPEEVKDMMREMMLADMGIDPDEIEEMELPDEIKAMELPDLKWYDPQEGLDWVSKVSEHVRTDSSSVRNPSGVLADLEEYRVVLEQAKQIGALWNLQVDF